VKSSPRTRAVVVGLAVPVAIAGGLAVPNAVGAASHEPSHSHVAATKQRFVLYAGNLHNRDIVDVLQAKGPIHGVGIARPNDDATGAAVPITVKLPDGKVFLKAKGPFVWKPDLAACTATEHDRGTYRIVSGTGAYQGASGRGRYSERGAGVGVTASDGSCEQKFRINYVRAVMRGHTSL